MVVNDGVLVNAGRVQGLGAIPCCSNLFLKCKTWRPCTVKSRYDEGFFWIAADGEKHRVSGFEVRMCVRMMAEPWTQQLHPHSSKPEMLDMPDPNP